MLMNNIIWINKMEYMKLSSIDTSYVTPLKPSDTIQHAMNVMKTESISSVVIVDKDQKPIGIFTEHDAIKTISSHRSIDTPLDRLMTKNVFTIIEDTYIHDAYVLMEQKNYRHLIIINIKGVYTGVITEGDFLRHIGFDEISKNKKIEDAMSDSILTIDSNASLMHTALMMAEKKSDYAIIIKDNIPIGIINERDITHYCAENIYIEENNSEKTSISILDNKKMYLINKNTSLFDATNTMKEHGIHQLIVIDQDEKLIGLVTRHDILKAIHGSYFDYLLETIKIKNENEKNLLKHKKELEKLANYDQLTDLPNRLFFQAYLKRSIAKAVRYKRTLGVIILDLDRFKDVNDSYGHTMGDELLKIISERLQSRVRDSDLVARIGGDEFAIVLEELSSEEDIAKVITEVLNTISDVCILPNGVEVHMEASAGIVIAPKDAKSVEQVIQYADSALYQAKADGNGLYRFYTDEMTQKAIKKLAYETALRAALENNELELYYQPQVHIKTGKIISVEALLRWNIDEGKQVPPSIFIPIAEESGLINKIGEWVIDRACTQGKKWHDMGHNLTIAINISANQVKFQDIPSLVTEALNKTAYPANKLELEITESSLMQREEEVTLMLHALRAKGIRLAIDDFGTGYSSLSYLKRFPIDVLKIDKSFIDDLPFEKEDMAIVIAIIEMGKALGYQVLAEGIEEQEQLDFLTDKGCNLYQGFLKSKAIPADEFEKFLRSQSS